MTLAIRPIETIHGVVQNNNVITGLCVVTKPETRLRERNQDVLLLHVTVTGSLKVADELQNELVDQFVETYYNTAGTVNATLRHAVHSANNHLLNANEGQEEIRTAVLCGIVVRDGKLWVVQVGQSQAFIGTANGVKEMDDFAPKRVSPIGKSEAIDFSLFQTKVTKGDTVLIVAPNLVDIPKQRIKPIIVNQPMDVAEQRLMHILRQRTARCILAQVTIAHQPNSAYDSKQEIEGKVQWEAVQPALNNQMSGNDLSDTLWEGIEEDDEQLTNSNGNEEYDYEIDLEEDQLNDVVIAWEQTEMDGIDGLQRLPNSYGIGEEEPTIFTPPAPSHPSRPSELVDDEPPTLFHQPDSKPDIEVEERPIADNNIDDDQPPTLFHQAVPNPKVDDPDDVGAIGEDLIAAEAIRRRRRRTMARRNQAEKPKHEKREKKVEQAKKPQLEASLPLPLPPPAPTSPANTHLAKTAIRPPSRLAPLIERIRRGSASFLYWLSHRVQGVAMALGRFNSNDEATATERWISLAFAVFTPLVVMIIITSAWLRGQQNQLLNGIRKDVSVAIQRLDMVETPAQKQVYYNYIIDQIEVAEKYEQNDTQLNGWKTDFAIKLDQLNGMVNLKSDRVVDYGNRVALKSFALGSEPAIGFYTLDTENETVLYTPSDRNNPVAPDALIQSKDAAGTHVVGEIIDIAWRTPAQGESGIALLDRGGALVTQYADDEREVLTLDLSSEWITPIQMEMYAGRVYVLDRGNALQDGRIWRYVPSPNRLGLIIDKDKPAIVLPDLDQAVDFAITNDGNIIVLYEDGRIRRYTTSGNTVTTIWDETTVRNSGLHQPMVAPRALALSNTGFQPAIFILDSGSGRIIQISPAGILQGQYRANNRQNINDDIVSRTLDITVQTAPLRVYLLTETELYLAQD